MKENEKMKENERKWKKMKENERKWKKGSGRLQKGARQLSGVGFRVLLNTADAEEVWGCRRRASEARIRELIPTLPLDSIRGASQAASKDRSRPAV